MPLLAYNMAGTGPVAAARLPHSPKPSKNPFFPSPSPWISRRRTHVTEAKKGLSSRARRPEQRRKGAAITIKEEEEDAAAAAEAAEKEGWGGVGELGFELSTAPMPQLPGEEKDFWEGPQWDALGFFVQYQWAFGIVFALIACGIAVATYNEGATDFRKTPIYKQSIQSQELLEEPDASGSDVFETNPTEVAPSLE